MKPLTTYTLLLNTIVAAAFLSGCRDTHQPANTQTELPMVEITTESASRVPVENQIEILGTVESVNRVQIAAKVSGTITSLPVVLGSEITKGQTIVEISAGEIDAKVQQSKAQLEQARRNLEREKKLLKQKAATRETVRSLTESVEIAEAAYQEALTFQQYTRIQAPIDGQVTRKHVNKGDLATPGRPLLDIEDNNHLQVITDIPERFIPSVKQGDTLTIKVPATGTDITGTIAEVAPTADPATRTAPVKIDITAADQLYGGQFVRVTLGDAGTDTVTIPRSALSSVGQMERVFVVENNRAQLRLVRSGAGYGERVEILSGLSGDEIVVSSSTTRLQDGQPVTIR